MSKTIFSVSDDEVLVRDPVMEWRDIQAYRESQEFFSKNLEHDQSPMDFKIWWSEEHSKLEEEDLLDY